MSAFTAVFSNELTKMFKRKKYVVFLIIGMAICILWTVIGGVASNLIGRFGGGFMINLTPTPMGVLPIFLQILIPLLIFMGATDLITAEGAEGTMKGIICRPAERWKIYFGKLLAIISYAAIYLACIFIISSVLNQIFGRGGNFNDFSTAFMSYLLTIPPLAVLAAFAMMLAVIGRGATLTMLLLIVIYMAMSALPVIFPIFSEIFFTSYLGWHRLWIGALPQMSRIVQMLVVLISSGITFLMAGSLIFDKKEY